MGLFWGPLIFGSPQRASRAWVRVSDPPLLQDGSKAFYAYPYPDSEENPKRRARNSGIKYCCGEISEPSDGSTILDPSRGSRYPGRYHDCGRDVWIGMVWLSFKLPCGGTYTNL